MVAGLSPEEVFPHATEVFPDGEHWLLRPTEAGDTEKTLEPRFARRERRVTTADPNRRSPVVIEKR